MKTFCLYQFVRVQITSRILYNLDKSISLHIRDPVGTSICHCLSSVLALVSDECTTRPPTCASFGDIILCPQLFHNKSLHSVKNTGIDFGAKCTRNIYKYEYIFLNVCASCIRICICNRTIQLYL